jgi:hypothetical protein
MRRRVQILQSHSLGRALSKSGGLVRNIPYASLPFESQQSTGPTIVLAVTARRLHANCVLNGRACKRILLSLLK